MRDAADLQRAADLRRALAALLNRVEALGRDCPGLADSLVRERVADFLYVAVVDGRDETRPGPFGLAGDGDARLGSALRAYADAARPALSAVPEDERVRAVWDGTVASVGGLRIDDVAGAL